MEDEHATSEGVSFNRVTLLEKSDQEAEDGKRDKRNNQANNVSAEHGCGRVRRKMIDLVRASQKNGRT